MKRYTYIVGAAVLALTACKPEFKPEEGSSGDINPSKFVMIGGGGVAGYMNDGLTREGQENSLAAILAGQLELVGGGSFVQPFVGAGSVGISLQGNAPFKLDYRTDCLGETSLGPVRTATQGDMNIWNENIYGSGTTFGNYGIPDLRLEQVTLYDFSDINPYFARFSSNSSSTVLGDASATQPTFFALYLGLEDALSYAQSGGTVDELPTESVFESVYRSIVTTLPSIGSKGVIATIPNVAEMPYFNTIPWNGLTLDAENAQTLNNIYNPIGFEFTVGSNPFMIEDPEANMFEVRQILPEEKILLSVPLDSVKCNQVGTLYPIRDEFILTNDEQSYLQSKIDAYNAIILSIAEEFNLAVVRSELFYQDLSTSFTYNGVSMSATFVSGGAYSLDGRYFTAKGNALFANEFIKAINARYNATIPQVNAGNYNTVLFP